MVRPSPNRYPVPLIIAMLACLSASALGRNQETHGPSPFQHPESLARIYSQRGQAPIWTNGRVLTPQAMVLVAMIAAVADDGLDPADYHAAEINRLLASRKSGQPAWQDRLAARRAESLLTDAFLALGTDLARGRIESGALWAKWPNLPHADDHLTGLEAALVLLPETAPGLGDSAAGTVAAILEACRPDQEEYRALRLACHRLNQVAAAGGWDLLVAGELIRPGDRDSRVSLLRSRLRTGGDLAPSWLVAGIAPNADGQADWYSPDLVRAVRIFQGRHGLDPDGIIGPATLAAFNVPAAERASQVALNLERWRWMPRDLGSSHLRVNIPDYTLSLITDGTATLTMRAIVGRPDRPTPVLSGMIRWLVLNPRWNVPQKLAREDLLPRVAADPEYLAERGIRIFTDWHPGSPEIDPGLVDWPGVVSWDMAFKFQQDPGPHNPLGKIKFLFPNPFSVYIHDTNQRASFAAERRCLSSGCVRVEDPKSLLLALALTKDGKPDSTVHAVFDNDETVSVDLAQPVPVHLMYMTAWVGPDGALQFREDCYGYDEGLREALAARSTPVPDGRNQPSSEPLTVAKSDRDRPEGGHQVRTGPVSTWRKSGPE